MHRVLRRRLALAAPVVLVAAFASAVPAPAQAAKVPSHPRPVQPRSVAGTAAKPVAPKADPSAGDDMRTATAVTWPAAGTVDAPLPAQGRFRTGVLSIGRSARAGAASAVSVSVLDRAAAARAGVAGLLIRVGRADGVGSPGPVSVSVGYTGFRDAYGGGWGNRLRLLRVPECALSTPSSPGCAPTPVPSVNDLRAGTVTGDVTAAATAQGTLVALAAAPSSSGGDFTASALQPSATWSAGGQSGDFEWTFPLRMPPSLGGPAPKLAVGYSSQSLDGKTAATNSQPSWVGDGFGLDSGVITRVYKACSDDGQPNVGDECWGGDNATLSMAGHSGELIQDATNPNLWHLKADDGTRIERLTGAANGDNDGEYWKVTTLDGTQFFFGLDHLPGWTGGPGTGSAYTVPVFGNGAGEPCHQATFANSWCSQAYQWNLDYVVDTHHNTMSYWYATESNAYSRDVTDSAVSTYVRAGTLARIEYGTRQDNGVDSHFSGAPAQVVFGVEDRCVTQGSTCVSTNPPNWPDVPWDQSCTSTTSCPGRYAPTFWSQKMLATITTQIRSGSGYQDVEQWTFDHTFKDPGDGHAKTLWLSGISHAGLVGGTATVPDLTFGGQQMNNRVDVSAAADPIIRYRITSIVSETGGETDITYSPPQCVAGSDMPSSPDANAKRCYPVYWTPYLSSTPTFGWFHKYVVAAVSQGDQFSGGAWDTTTYTYLDSPAWHYDEAEFVPASHKSWGQWRGYSRVRVTHGQAGDVQSQTDTVYFRGMDGDKTTTGTRSVSIVDSNGAALADSDWLSGMTRETTTYNGTGDSAPVVSRVFADPYAHGPTATRSRNGVTVNAYYTNTKKVTTVTTLDHSPGSRTTVETNTFDYDDGTPNPVGRITMVDDAGDAATTADDRCTRYTFATNPAEYLMSALAEVETVGVACATAPDRNVDVLTDTRTWYDGATSFDRTVSKGDATRTEQLSNWNNGSPTYTQKTCGTFDANGRILDAYDALDRKTSTAYLPATGGPVTGTAVTNPMGWTTTTTLNPAWGLPASVRDPNGRTTIEAYDPLGRLTAVWQPERDPASQTASLTFAYALHRDAVSAVATSKLTGSGYLTTFALYDGLLRARQTQAPAVGGGRDLTDTTYDSRGLVAAKNDTYYNSAAPAAVLWNPTTAVPGRTVDTYDSAGGLVSEAFLASGAERWRTTTYYGGDHTDVTPPTGATPTSKYVDARGNTTELRQYPGGATPTGTTYDATTYTYTRAGSLATLTDPAGHHWTWTYNQLGQQVSAVDPDKGTITNGYDALGELLTTTDARGVTLAYTYDALGRKTNEYQGSTSGPRLASWTYDMLGDGTPILGQPVGSTRYIGAAAYTTRTTGYDAAYRPTGSKVTIPTGPLAGTYSTSMTYNADGTPATMTLPAGGSLPAETLTYGYGPLGLPTTLTGLSTYVTVTGYDDLGRMTSVHRNSGNGHDLAETWFYEDGTNRLQLHEFYGDMTPNTGDETSYTYDNAGHVTSAFDETDVYASGPDDYQCFRYDYLGRLSAVWSPNTANCAGPTTSTLGGPAPYWQSFTYDVTGNRLTEVDHATAANTTHTSAYGAQPHTLSTLATTGPGGNRTDSYTYDAAGNTLSRPSPGGIETITWDAEGHPATVTAGGKTSTYIYDADGNRLVATDGTGTTVYLGWAEYHAGTNNTVTCTREYSFAGRPVAARNPSALTWIVGDPNGTTTEAVDAATGTLTKRRFTPFGQLRGADPAWPNASGFGKGTRDATDLTHLGARDYDPSTGRFISADPIRDVTDPQQLNGYAYADNAAPSASDPSGKRVCLDECGGDADKQMMADIRAKHQNAAASVPNPGCQGSASDCDPDAGKPNGPWDVLSRTFYGNGTVLTYYRNGVITINGYVLPPGCKDPALLAQRVDDQNGWDPDANEKTRMLLATGMVGLACNPQACTLDFKETVQHQHWLLINEAMQGTIGVCVSATLVMGKGGGAEVCLVSDGKVPALAVSTIKANTATVGVNLSGYLQSSTAGDVSGLCGPFSYGGGSLGEGWTFDASDASGGGVLVSTVGAGGGYNSTFGLPVSGGYGTSNTRWVITFGSDGIHQVCGQGQPMSGSW